MGKKSKTKRSPLERVKKYWREVEFYVGSAVAMVAEGVLLALLYMGYEIYQRGGRGEGLCVGLTSISFSCLVSHYLLRLYGRNRSILRKHKKYVSKPLRELYNVLKQVLSVDTEKIISPPLESQVHTESTIQKTAKVRRRKIEPEYPYIPPPILKARRLPRMKVERRETHDMEVPTAISKKHITPETTDHKPSYNPFSTLMEIDGGKLVEKLIEEGIYRISRETHLGSMRGGTVAEEVISLLRGVLREGKVWQTSKGGARIGIVIDEKGQEELKRMYRELFEEKVIA